MNKLILILSGLLFAVSCSKDPSFPSEGNENRAEDVQVRLVVTIPASTVYARTRGTTRETDQESVIGEIQVLVFENGKYRYRVPGISITSGATNTTFTALLKTSTSPVKLLILANSTAAVLANEPAVDDTEEVVKKKISAEFDFSASDFPMYGEYSLPQGLTGTEINSISGIKMLRAIARVDVNASQVTNFKLTGVKAYRANTLVQVIPDQTGVLKVTSPSVPTASESNLNSSMYVVSDADMNEFSAALYLPEAATPPTDLWVSKATCVVVEGYYAGNSKLSYYRMDFDPGNNDNAFGQVLRNHKYIFNIRKVSAPGWDTPDEAANNRSAHIDVEVQAWDDNTLDMYFDGEHYFGVSTRDILLKNVANSSGIIEVSTDLSDYTLQWSDAQGTVSGTASLSLTNTYFEVKKAESGTQLVVTALQSNASNDTRRTQYFVITANRWQILVKIEQRYDTAVERVINLLTFNTGLGDLGINIITPTAAAQSRSDGLRGILGNLSNFGPTGTVVCGGYNLLRANVSANNLTDMLFSTVDVVYVHYMASAYFGTQDAVRLHNWLKADKSRVLLITYDANDVNLNVLTEFLYGYDGILFSRTNDGPYPLATQTAANAYFTQTGPFTLTPYTPVAAGFSFRNYDAYHGEISLTSEAAKGITPILLGPNGGIVLGVDYSRRIVYMGDVDLGNASNGVGATTDNHINNTTGTIDNSASKLMANVFAWVTETVLNGD